MKSSIPIDAKTLSGFTPEATERRFRMIAHNGEKADMAYCKFREKYPAYKDIVVILLDCNDELGKMMAFGTNQQAYVEYYRKEIDDQKMLPTMITAMTRQTAVKILAAWQHLLHKHDARNPKESTAIEGMRKPAPAGCYWVMAISGGKQLGWSRIPEGAINPSSDPPTD